MIRVLVVDDSALVRKVLAEELSRFPDVEVVATAADPYIARERILEHRPDVVTLDLEMPRMDGLSFLARLMRHHPLPVVVVSSIAPEGSDNALRALELGAVEVVPKPGSHLSVPDAGRHLIRAVRAAAVARLRRSAGEPPATPSPAPRKPAAREALTTTHRVLAIGASTGGTRAIESVLRALPPDGPGTVIVQHMPTGFTDAFARRLDQVCPMEVREGRSGDTLVPGLALIAPGGRHMVLRRNGARYHVDVRGGPPVHHQRPAVDVLFDSVARHAGANAVGVILTGMGSDGAAGLKSMRERGAPTLAQDRDSSIVWGMPGAAVEMEAAERVVSLGRMPDAILDALGGKRPARAAATKT